MRKTCLNTIYNLAKKNKKIIFIGSDLGPGVLEEFKSNIPKRNMGLLLLFLIRVFIDLFNFIIQIYYF